MWITFYGVIFGKTLLSNSISKYGTLQAFGKEMPLAQQEKIIHKDLHIGLCIKMWIMWITFFFFKKTALCHLQRAVRFGYILLVSL